MNKKLVWLLFIGLVVFTVISGIAWAEKYSTDDVVKELQGLRVETIGLKEYIKYTDWKINLLIALVVAILGFVFYLAREIGAGTREKIEKIPRLEQSLDHLRGCQPACPPKHLKSGTQRAC